MRLLLSLLLLCACGPRPEHLTIPSEAIAQREHDFITSFYPSTIEPCDRVTFQALFDAYGARTPDLYKFEVESGKWIRNYAVDCSAPTQSGSECSLDGEMSVFQALAHRGDKAGLSRMRDRLIANNWQCGNGPSGVVDSFILDGLFVQEKLVDLPFLNGFQAYLVAEYIWMDGQISGAIGSIELETLKILAQNHMHEPLFHALYHKYSDGDQSYTESLLTDWDFSANTWGSCPEAVAYILAVEAMK